MQQACPEFLRQDETESVIFMVNMMLHENEKAVNVNIFVTKART